MRSPCNNLARHDCRHRSAVPEGETGGRRRGTRTAFLQPHFNAEHSRGSRRRRPGRAALLLRGGHVHGHHQLHPERLVGSTEWEWRRLKDVPGHPRVTLTQAIPLCKIKSLNSTIPPFKTDDGGRVQSATCWLTPL